MSATIAERAQKLVTLIVTLSTQDNGFGSLSTSVYDTAWVAMVERHINRESKYIFPQCFDYLESTQLPDGSWQPGDSSIDCILNSLAALLALKKRHSQTSDSKTNTAKRCEIAVTALQRMLQQWDINKTDRVGFEILVPNLLKLLENEGIHFEFPGLEGLLSLCNTKLKRLQPALTGPKQSTLVHSLEALVGMGSFDFNLVKHYILPDGSMFGSPSSTAAYLMNSSPWDTRAENYLRTVFNDRREKGKSGEIPSAFPTTIFEISWVMATLLESGFTSHDFHQKDLDIVVDLLQENLTRQGGLLGFAPYCLPDADDTAKSLTVLSILGKPCSIGAMIAEFEADSYFLTYHGERNPSISANCNILMSILHSPDNALYTKQIMKCVRYLSQSWLSGSIQDKWNISRQYPAMLVAQALILFIDYWAKNKLSSDSTEEVLLRRDIPAILSNILTVTIEQQQQDGSWDSKREVTAYAVLTLVPLLSLPWPGSLRAEIVACVERGKEYLELNQQYWTQEEHLWIEKVAYGSNILSQTYCLAASRITVHLNSSTAELYREPDKKLVGFKKFFSSLPLFSGMPAWNLDLALFQSFQLAPLLKRASGSIFKSGLKETKEDYLGYIPFTWIGCAGLRSSGISADQIWDMIIISMLNFQADAYMENVVAISHRDNLGDVKAIVHELCNSLATEKEPSTIQNGSKHLPKRQRLDNGYHNGEHSNGLSNDPLKEVKETLGRFITHVLKHPKVLQSSARLQSWLRHELEIFLVAHMTHIEDCSGLSKPVEGQEVALTFKSNSTYFNWVRSTGADHTSCPYSFVFFLCLISTPGQDLTADVHCRYLLEDGCRHLAVSCRQFNDFGSVVRDREEENLNSINFPEFEPEMKANGNLDIEDEQNRKKELLRLAQYERRMLDAVLVELKQCSTPDLMLKLGLFIDVTDSYGQIYVARDIGIRRAANGHAGEQKVGTNGHSSAKTLG